jgi:hypothetical protein
MIAAASIQAQFMPRSLHAGNQSFIEDAVKGGIFIVRQSYQLKNTSNNTLYGWGHAEHFGYTLSLGIKAENGYYLDLQAVEPWKYDSKFASYNDQRHYIPLVSESRYRSLTDSSFFAFPYQSDSVKPVIGSPFCWVRDSVFDNQGFEIDASEGRKEGWLVWVVSSDSTEITAHASFSLLIYRNEVAFESAERTYNIKDPATSNRILGGFYVTPHTTAIGKVSFRISGFLSKKEDSWQIVRLGESVSKEWNEGLTPIRQQ